MEVPGGITRQSDDAGSFTPEHVKGTVLAVCNANACVGEASVHDRPTHG